MLFTGKQLQDILKAREGTLRDVPFAVLMHAVSAEERSVVLEIKRNQLEKKILFEDGIPVDCRSNLLHETMGKFLVVRGKISEEDYQRCLAESAKTRTLFGEVMMRMELISAFDFFKMMQQNLAHKLLDGFTWRDGTWKLLAEVPPVESPLKVRVPQLLLTGITRYVPQEQVDEGIGALVGVTLTLNPKPPMPLAHLKLGTKHSRVAQLLKGRLRLDELMAESRLPPEELTRLLYTLALLSVVSNADQVPVVTAAPEPPPPPPPPPLPVPVVAPLVLEPVREDVEKLRNEVMRVFLGHRKLDAFDLLGIPVTAQATQMREAYLAYAEKYAPWRFADGDLQPLQEKAQDLFLAGARAFALLQDSEARNSLIHRKQTAHEAPRKDHVNHFAIRTELLDSETQYREGTSRLAAGRYQDAIDLLEFASDCDPQNGLYRSDLAWARYKLNPLRAAELLKNLLETIRMDPECGAAYLYAGELCRSLGDRTTSEAHLRRACKLMTGDRRPVEALKQLLTEPARR